MLKTELTEWISWGDGLIEWMERERIVLAPNLQWRVEQRKGDLERQKERVVSDEISTERERKEAVMSQWREFSDC
jgi:hypothetical protein